MKKKRPLRILMIAPTSFFSDYGGHIRIYEETRALQAMGHEVIIVTYYKGSDLPGLDIRRTAPLPYRTDYEVGSSRHKLAFDLFLAARSIVEGLKVRPDVVHGHMHEGALIGGMVAKLLGVPLLFDFQGSLTAEMVDHNFLQENGRFHRLFLRLEKFINQLPKAIFTSSHQAKELLEQSFQIPAGRIHPLPDCADIDRFHPAHFSPERKSLLRQQLGIAENVPIIAYLGLLTDYQGIPHLIHAARRFKQWGQAGHFLIMGYPNLDHYRQMATKGGVADIVTFTGRVAYKQAPLYLSLGNVAVAPKMSMTEGSGKLLNYMALAQPIVAYDTPVHREYLGENGRYVPFGKADAFAVALRDLVNAPEEQAIVGQKLRRRAISHFSWTQAAQRIVQVYESLLNSATTAIPQPEKPSSV